MAKLFARLEHGAIDITQVACRPGDAHVEPGPHIHIAVKKIRRWHPGYWILIARVLARELSSLRIHFMWSRG